MLSKSTARAFFLAGTLLCTVAFVGLTIDTFAKIPAQTRSSAITAAVAHGKELWDENNCMGCHTLMGEGAYYAPELTKVYERRGSAFIRAMLRDPEAMYPGQRRMVKYDFSEQEIDDLVAFFEWVGQVDLNGFPAPPTIAPPAAPPTPPDGEPAPGARPLAFDQICTACHAVDGRGGRVGPALDGVASRFDADYLKRWLRDPNTVKPGTTMPKLPLEDAEIDALVAYLTTLEG